ncbi:MAG: hypothetical protein H7335_17185 [Massilia sp.]|nr:hypothetical protein [Massilia sp.]
MTPRHLLLGVALLLAAGFAFFGDKRPEGVVEATPRAPPRANLGTSSGTGSSTIGGASNPNPAITLAILRLEPRDRLIADGVGANAGAQAFASHNWTPPPPPAPPQQPMAPPAPTAPPLPFIYLGKVAANGEWEVFLARGDQTLVVRRALVIDGVYRIESIAPPLVTLTYLPLNQIQQLNIGVSD